jgi:cephalosporin hydroxylase
MSDAAPSAGEAIRSLLVDGRSDEALQLVERELERAPEQRELLALLVDCLVAVGQFERALHHAGSLLARDPDQPGVRAQLQMLTEQMEPPAYGPTDPTARSYASELPQALLLRMQQAVHHQRYRGVQFVKSPFDIAIYQQLVDKVRPRTIIEIGSKAGGSGLFFGDMLRNFEIDGHVLSFDLVPVTDVTHPFVSYRRGNGRRFERALSPEQVAELPRPLLVIEDADHTYETSSAVLAYFHPLLRAGDWIVVEDGNLSDMYPTLFTDGLSGPHAALREFFARRGADYRLASEFCDLYAYNATTASNGILERR